LENEYTVIVRPLAALEFSQHIEFLARKSISAANRIVDDFERLEIVLSKNPASFPKFYKNFRKAIIKPLYPVLFEIEGKMIFIEKILDMRQFEYNDIINELTEVNPNE